MFPKTLIETAVENGYTPIKQKGYTWKFDGYQLIVLDGDTVVATYNWQSLSLDRQFWIKTKEEFVGGSPEVIGKMFIDIVLSLDVSTKNTEMYDKLKTFWDSVLIKHQS